MPAWAWAVIIGALFLVTTDPRVLGDLLAVVAAVGLAAVIWRAVTWRPAEPARRALVAPADAPAPVARRAAARISRGRAAAPARWVTPDLGAVLARAERAEREREQAAAEAAALRAERDDLARQLAELTGDITRAGGAPGADIAELRAQLARRADQVSKRVEAPGIAVALADPRSGARPLVSGGAR